MLAIYFSCFQWEEILRESIHLRFHIVESYSKPEPMFP